VQELRQTWRALLQRKAYFVACAATLTLVLGANAAMFAVVNATILRPMPFATKGERENPGAETVTVKRTDCAGKLTSCRAGRTAASYKRPDEGDVFADLPVRQWGLRLAA
jgi:hypothetical protein